MDFDLDDATIERLTDIIISFLGIDCHMRDVALVLNLTIQKLDRSGEGVERLEERLVDELNEYEMRRNLNRRTLDELFCSGAIA